MKIEKELPKNYEEFEDYRKESFIEVKNYKEKGGRLVGYLCTYTPLEIFDAAGAASVALCGMSEENIPLAETVLPKNLCPLIKSTYGFALSDTCPYTYFSDIIIGETTCDGKKKMYELLNNIKRTYVMHLPQGRNREYAREMWYQEVKLLIEEIEKLYSIKISEEDLRKAAEKRNRWRIAMNTLHELQVDDNYDFSSIGMTLGLQKNIFSEDSEEEIAMFEKKIKEINENKSQYLNNNKDKPKRILITGCPISGVINKIQPIIEDNNAKVVCYDNCSGEASNRRLVNLNTDNIVRAISDRYLEINCSIMTPNDDRLDSMKYLIEKYKVDGVIEVVLQACHTFNIEAEKVREMVREELSIPYLKIETDYSKSDVGQLNTRISAFVEML